ncbi:hypothetical protein B484DRAFT_241499 [Ochromonadaceae sp. CCMP2298]|nr:hypothetical protein B484DRAFT_241499 [Ochromonadaceae sp. CCMP2298]
MRSLRIIALACLALLHASTCLALLSCSAPSFLRHARRMPKCQAGHFCSPIDINVMEWDVVEYQEGEGPSQGTTLGAVVGGGSLVHPLCVREPGSEGPDSDFELFFDESLDPVPIDGKVVSVVNDAFYSQRSIEDRVSNPHGEHAEDMWILTRKQVSKLLADSTSLKIRRGEALH